MRNNFDDVTLLDLWQWSEQTFLSNTEGSAIRRTGYQGFMRNVAIGLGNAPYDPQIIAALRDALPQHDDVVAEHIHWAIEQQLEKQVI